MRQPHTLKNVFCGWYCLRNRNKASKGLEKEMLFLLRKTTSIWTFVTIKFKLDQQCHNRHRVTLFIQKCYKMHCGVRLHGRNACYVIFCNIASKHWIYMDRGYCISFYLYWRLYSYWGYVTPYVIECDFAVEGHILLKILLL